MNRKGFAIFTTTWIFLIFASGILLTAHFLGQRLAAMKRLNRIAGHIHRLHQTDFHGKKSFRKTFDRPPKDAAKEKMIITRRTKVKWHHIAINFGKND